MKNPSDAAPGIVSAQLLHGRVLVHAHPAVAAQNLRVEIGAETFPLRPEQNPDPVHFFAIDPAEGAEYELHVNKLESWRVRDVQTAQFVFHDRRTKLDLPLGRPLRLPAGPGLVLRAWLANHRAHGKLRVRLVPAEGGEAQETSIEFGRAFSGGKTLDGYQAVTMHIPASQGGLEVSLYVEYGGSVDPDGSNDPFLFVAGARIMGTDTEEISVPAVFADSRTSGPGKWFSADLPALTPDTAPRIIIAYGDRRIQILRSAPIGIALGADHGHTFSMRADTAQQLIAWINGAPAFPVNLSPEMRHFRVPPRYLTGEYARIQMRDPSGTVIYWDNWAFLPNILTPFDVLQKEAGAPYPHGLSVQAEERFRALRAHMDDPGTRVDNAQLGRALKTLEAGYDRLSMEPLSFPEHDAPDVSVIIPAHNKVRVTYAGLAALLLAHNKASFEVIFVDDASTDETGEIETLVSGITVLHNKTPQRFIRACNAGVAQARGKYIVLLNNDTEPTSGWLDELIGAFNTFDNVGLAGSKLLYPDGRLQDAGGIIWQSGNPRNYGNRQNPWEPKYSYARQADYLSGAAMMTTREIWDKVGGLSSYLEPMYFEDTDFAFKIRDAGYTTWFVPASIVYHYEGATSGTDTSSGFKRYQEVNRPKFKRRWARDFARFGKEGADPDLEKDRDIVGRILFVDHKIPTPDQDAGSYATLQEMRLAQSLGYKVTFLPQNLAHLGRYTTDLGKIGIEVISAPFVLSFDEFLDARIGEFDAVYITRYNVAQVITPKIRARAPNMRILMNNCDLHFLRELRRGLAENDPDRIAESETVRENELAAMRQVNVVLSYNEIEHSVIQSHTNGAVTVMKCPWVVDCPSSVPARSERAGLSFLGSFNHPPNLEGVDWFAAQVMPRLAQSRPDLMLSVYGAGMQRHKDKLESANIDPVGFIENAADAFDRHLVFVAPLLSGAGIKGKVISALAHGIPCVLTPVAAEATGMRDGYDCFIAETPDAWIRAIDRLLNEPELWAQVSSNARALAESQFSFVRGREDIRRAFEAVDLFASRP